MFLGTALKKQIFLVFLLVIFYLLSEEVLSSYVPNCTVERLRAAVGVLVGHCCPALLNCIDVDVHPVVLLGKIK